MTEIKRYDVVSVDGVPAHRRSESGRWVKHGDLAELQDQLQRYSMSAGQADQRKAESDAVRVALGFTADADDVAPCDLVDAIAALQEQVRELAAQWVFVSESGNPSVPAGERAEFWVCHADKDGQHSVTKLTWFNHVEPDEDDQDAIDCCEMSTPDGESFWPFGWHEEFSSHDFDHFYEPSRLKVVAYAPFTAPGVPLSIRAGEQP